MKILFFSRPLLALVGLLTFSQCSQAAQENTSSLPAPEMAASGGQEAAADAAESKSAAASNETAPAPTPASRLLIYHAEATVKVAALPRAAHTLDSLVQAAGAYVSAGRETRADGEWRQQTQVRVPPAGFQQFLRAVGRLGTLEQKVLRTDDVTAAHADLTARLLARRALEQEYLRLLKQARKVSEMLEVEEKLGQVREEIEATQSQLKGMNDLVAYSTIDLTLYQPLALSAPDAPVTSFGSRLVTALYTGWEVLVGLCIGVLTIWPLWLLGGAGWLWWRRRKQKRGA